MQHNENLKLTKKVSRSVDNIYLDNEKVLHLEKITEVIEQLQKMDKNNEKVIAVISKKILDRKVENMCFNLIEVTADMIANYRKKGIPSIVVKIDGTLYHSEIPNNISFLTSNLLGTHQCSSMKDGCRRLSAASDEKGGCEKVRNKSTYIERYPWIITGFETFNTRLNSFVVINCLHFESIR